MYAIPIQENIYIIFLQSECSIVMVFQGILKTGAMWILQVFNQVPIRATGNNKINFEGTTGTIVS